MKRTNGSWKKGFATLGIVTLLVVALVGCGDGGAQQRGASEVADVGSDAPEQPAVDISSLQQKLDDLIQRQQEAAANRTAERAVLEKEIADLRVLLDASPAEVRVGTDCDDFYEAGVWVGTDCDDFYEEAAADDEFAEDAASGQGDYSHVLDVMQGQNADQANTFIPQEQNLGETRTQEFGTPIGTRGEVKCDKGSVISALDLNAGGVIDSIRFLYSDVMRLNDEGSATWTGTSYGGRGGNRKTHGNLGPFSGAALKGVKVKVCRYGGSMVISELVPFFTKMTGQGHSKEGAAFMNELGEGDSNGPIKGHPHGRGAHENEDCGDWQPIICPANAVATGAVVHASSFVNGLQLICQDQQALLGNAQAKQVGAVPLTKVGGSDGEKQMDYALGDGELFSTIEVGSGDVVDRLSFGTSSVADLHADGSYPIADKGTVGGGGGEKRPPLQSAGCYLAGWHTKSGMYGGWNVITQFSPLFRSLNDGDAACASSSQVSFGKGTSNVSWTSSLCPDGYALSRIIGMGQSYVDSLAGECTPQQ